MGTPDVFEGSRREGSEEGSTATEEGLQVLRDYGVPETPPEAAFDRVTELAAAVFDVPMALLSLIGEDRRWIKSTVGFDESEIPVDLSLGIHAVRSDGVTVVEDATEDERFADNPLVRGEPGIRFSAAAPLATADGFRLGSLCVFDTETRAPGPDHLRHLEHLAAMAVNELELRREVAEHEETEHALRTERDRFETLFHSLPTPVVHGIEREDSTIVLRVNEAFERVFGYEAEAVRGKDLNDIIVPPESAHGAVELDRNADSEQRVEVEVRRLTTEGLRDFRLQVAVHGRDDGPPEGYAIYTDISDQKEWEKQLQEAKDRAQEASRLKSAMLANMSHEVRTPLTSVIGFLEILLEQLDGDLRAFALKAFNSSQRLMETLESVLQLSKLEAGVADLELQAIDLRRKVNETVDMLSPEVADRGVQLAVELPEKPVEGVWNEGAINRIIGNLLENAVKFTPEGGRVSVRVQTDGEEAVLEVEDTGIGVSDAFLPRLFNAFEQEPKEAGHSYEGSGLGLSITQRLVEAHRGTIGVESRKGEGTCFTVRLPLSIELSEEEEDDEASSGGA